MVYKIPGKIKIRNLKVKYDNFWIKTLKNTHSIINYTVNICKNKLFYFVLLIIFIEKKHIKNNQISVSSIILSVFVKKLNYKNVINYYKLLYIMHILFFKVQGWVL